jgi:SAM-dependent methyltransferase
MAGAPRAAGHYERKQLFCGDRLIAWTHRSRFETGLQLVRELGPRSLLDFGCGDGTFIAHLLGGATRPLLVVGAEVQPSLVEDCRARLGGASGVSFKLTDELDASGAGRFEAIVCMEVFEHLVDPDSVLETFDRLLAPQGRIVISVPVEIGLPLLVKQVARRIAGWRGLGDYPGTTPYTLRELWGGLRAGVHQHISRPIHRAPDGTYFHCHKGFNWRAFQVRLARWFAVERVTASPPGLPPALASQIWFVAARPRSASAPSRAR